MKKRINRSFFILLSLSIISLSVLLSLSFHNAFKMRALSDIRENTRLVAGIFNSLADDSIGTAAATEAIAFLGDDSSALRVTIVSADGEVLFDNQFKVDSLPNHADRSEIRDALATGVGEATRFSATQMTETYYYALRLDDGSVLRLSRTVNSISGIIWTVLPAMLLVVGIVLLLANYMARRLTLNIIRPLADIDLDSSSNLAIYDELTPFAKRINAQRVRIDDQLAALQARADTITAITNNMQEGLILLDSTGRIMTANKSALAILGQNQPGIVTTDILHLCRDIDFQHGVEQCLAGANSEIVWLSGGNTYTIYFNPVLSADEIIGGVVLFFDITERKLAEQRRREFSANVSHELKTPLTSISALSEMIATGMAKEQDIADFANKISAQTLRLIDIIEDIIKLSEFDEGQQTREFTSFDLFDLAVMVIDSLKAQAAQKNVTVSLKGEHLMVLANRQMIDEMLFNLLDNAIKYNHEGGTVVLSLGVQGDGNDGGQVRISVTDNGLGIPLEAQSRVFERFFRVDGSRSKKTGGTGLGLSIVKHIVEFHNGHIELNSTPGSGTEIVCFIAQ